MNQDVTELIGTHGRADRIPEGRFADRPAFLDGWIITAPQWHPLWSQYFIALITLAPIEGVPAAVITRVGATHEIIVQTLDPTGGPYQADAVGPDHQLRFLSPGNVGEQFAAPDLIARDLIIVMTNAVVNGMISPETADAPSLIRQEWSTAVHATLDHYKDPFHGQAN